METHSNHALVGGVVLALMAGLAAFAMWLGGFGGTGMKEYDIFFRSVDGLSNGSQVTYLGVPSGEIKDIELWKRNPDFVRVRIKIKKETPILQGTKAVITTVGFTGSPLINLTGAIKGAAPITQNGPDGVPVIPTRPSAMNALLNSAPELMSRVMTLADNLSDVLSPANRKAISDVLANADELTSALASRKGEIVATIDQANVTLKRADEAVQRLDRMSQSAEKFMNGDGKRMSQNLNRTLAEAEKSLNALQGMLTDARPGMKRFSEESVPEISQIIQNLQQTTEALNRMLDQIDQQGASSLIGSPKVPTYRGGK